MSCNLHKKLAEAIGKESDLAAKKQTPDTARQRNALLKQIQEILKEIKGAASAPGGA